MTANSPNNIVKIDCSAQECLRRFATAKAAAPLPLFAVFGHHHPDAGFDYQNARELFLIQDPPKKLYCDVFSTEAASSCVRIFFGAHLLVQAFEADAFFKALEALKERYLVVCPYLPLQQTRSEEPFLALNWDVEIALHFDDKDAACCGLKILTENLSLASEFETWLTQILTVEPECENLPTHVSQQRPSQAKTFAADALSLNRKDFVGAVEDVQEKMKAGHAYLLNLAVQAKGLRHASDFSFKNFMESVDIEFLRYFIFFKYEDIAILSYSPERFIKIVDDCILTEPIKGTLQVGGSSAENTANACKELWNSEKEVNEQCLVVDLMRNDLNAFCTPGSVGVSRPFTIHKVGGLLQMQSYVFGEIKAGWKVGGILKSLLPAGSISGTPKIESCKIVSALEKTPRGFFTGIFGVADGPLQFESCILIRSHFMGNLGVYAGAGCGITTLSEPSDEFDEIEIKIGSFR